MRRLSGAPEGQHRALSAVQLLCGGSRERAHPQRVVAVRPDADENQPRAVGRDREITALLEVVRWWQE
jgi:hypothetical protein